MKNQMQNLDIEISVTINGYKDFQITVTSFLSSFLSNNLVGLAHQMFICTNIYQFSPSAILTFPDAHHNPFKQVRWRFLHK